MWRLSATTILLRRVKPATVAAAAATATPQAGGHAGFDYEVLFQKRGAGISRGGMYTFPGGVHEGEDADLKTTASAQDALTCMQLRGLRQLATHPFQCFGARA